MTMLALVIILISTWAVFSQRVKDGLFVKHCLSFSAICGVLYILGQSPIAFLSCVSLAFIALLKYGYDNEVKA